MVLDMARHCNEASMKLWADSDVITPGRWFRCEPGAKVLNGPSPFRKRSTWESDLPGWSGLGEQTPARTYDLGANPIGYHGRTHCGGESWLHSGGLHGRDEELTTDEDGSLGCCDLDIPATFNMCRPGQYVAGQFIAMKPEGDIVAKTGIMLVCHQGPVGGSPPAVVTDWALVESRTYRAGEIRLSVYRHVYGPSDPASWPFPFVANQVTMGVQFVFDGNRAQVDQWATDIGDPPVLNQRMFTPRVTPSGPDQVACYSMFAYNTSTALGGPFPPRICNMSAGTGTVGINAVEPAGEVLTPAYFVDFTGGFGNRLVLASTLIVRGS